MPKAEMNAALRQQTTSIDKYRLAKCYLTKYGMDSSAETKNYLQIVRTSEDIQWNADKGVEY